MKRRQYESSSNLFVVTGGMGSGKTTVSARLREHGAAVIDADAIVTDLQLPGRPMVQKMADILGEHVVVDGELNRAAAAEVMFSSSEKKVAVESVLHSLVFDQIDQGISAATEAVVVVDIPLFNGSRRLGEHALAGVVVVDVPVELAVSRLVEFRNFTPEAARKRIMQQISREERLSFADRVIVNDGELNELYRQTDDVWWWMQDFKSETDEKE